MGVISVCACDICMTYWWVHVCVHVGVYVMCVMLYKCVCVCVCVCVCMCNVYVWVWAHIHFCENKRTTSGVDPNFVKMESLVI